MDNQNNMANPKWEIDNKGRKYRCIGKGMIEYMPTTWIDGIEVPDDELEEFHRRRKEAKDREKAREMEEFRNRPAPKNCPFSNSCNNTCRRETCHLFIEGKCAIAILADAHGAGQIEQTEKTQAAKCPFSVYGRCEKCALNNNGCAIVRLAVSTMKGE